MREQSLTRFSLSGNITESHVRHRHHVTAMQNRHIVRTITDMHHILTGFNHTPSNRRKIINIVSTAMKRQTRLLTINHKRHRELAVAFNTSAVRAIKFRSIAFILRDREEAAARSDISRLRKLVIPSLNRLNNLQSNGLGFSQDLRLGTLIITRPNFFTDFIRQRIFDIKLATFNRNF